MSIAAIEAAKQIPQHMERLLGSIFSGSAQDQKNATGSLRRALSEVSQFVEGIEGISHGKPAKAAAPRRQAARRKSRRGHRRKAASGFKISSFLVEQLQASPKGLRPGDLVERVKQAVPGQHSNPQAIVNTTLSRLKVAGKAGSNKGVWKAK